MLQKIAAKHLRIGAWLAAGGGILFSFAFHAYKLYINLSFLGRDMLPYFIIAIAATMSRTLVMACISLVASFTILAISIYTYIDLIHTPDSVINDIEILTDPLKWMIALLVLGVVNSGFIYSKIRNSRRVL